MASASTKTWRASTTHSSLPPNPLPTAHGYTFNSRLYACNSPESSYYTNDQPDSCFGDDHSVVIDSECDSQFGSEEESTLHSNHEEHCEHHRTTLATHCNGLTYSGKKCSRKAHVFDEGLLPVCRTHQWSCRGRKQAGNCQATEECGYVCNRVAPRMPPYHLCEKHQKGTETLPCYITRLPTELRLMIFRYLLPDTITASRPHRSHVNHAHTAVLFVNRQFYQEAALLIYGELKFEARIWPTSISMFGKQWTRESTNTIFEELNEKLCRPSARRIRHLDVEISFAYSQSKVGGIGDSAVTYEDYELYQVRDTVRKLIGLLSPSLSESEPSALKRLRVTPQPSCKQHWRHEEATAAIFFVLEPFLVLGPIENIVLIPPPSPTNYAWKDRNFVREIADLRKEDAFGSLRKKWTKLMKGKTSGLDSIQKAIKATPDVVEAYQKIESFAQLIYKQDAVQFLGTAIRHGWTQSAFQGIERVLHIARYAYEHGDIACLQNVQEAVLKRWIIAHRQQQQSLSAITASVSAIFNGGIASRYKDYPEAFKSEDTAPSERSPKPDEMWPDIKFQNNVPGLRDSRIIYREECFRVIAYKDNEEQVFFKTPAIVRHMRVYKTLNPQAGEYY